jgi:3-phenylpropionate/trans-cinnamate dioxygenase ferredoxin subunit
MSSGGGLPRGAGAAHVVAALHPPRDETKSMPEYDAAALGDVPEGEAREFNVGGREIVLCNVEGEIYALQGMCTHEDLPLDGGEVDGTTLVCNWHGATYDVCTGRATGLPATEPLQTFETRVDGDRIFVTVPD